LNNLKDNIKSLILVAIVIMLSLLSALRLMEIQVVGDKDIKTPARLSKDAVTFTREIKATRGGIVDYSGNTIVTNDARCDLVLQKAFFPDDLREGNKAILGIYTALLQHGYTFKESLPISKEEPYVFTTEDPSEVISLLNLNVYATAENCIDKLIADYQIDDSYSQYEKRIIAGFRFEMLAKDFAYNIDLLLAENVDAKTVVEMKELSNFYPGIEAIEASDRRIVRGDILPHEIGTVGPIYAEEYEQLRSQGYALNDKVGKSGIELAMERTLRGTNGEEEVTVENGAVKDVRTIVETKSGNTVKLTVDGAFQLKLQSILDNFLNNFQSINTNPKLTNVRCGAIAVLDAKTGAVKGFANAPTYNLKDYVENYDYFLTAKDSPLLDRCTYGLYRPGSTFKTITATAGLNEGIITGNTTFKCLHDYFYHGGKFECTGTHFDISVRRAIEVSCNCFFYELSDRLGIDLITKYAQLYGLGQHTGLETGDAEGYLCNPETFAKHGQIWYIGSVIQAGIGNQDSGMTPLQMAVAASTIGNRGVRYKPYLVDSLYDYGSGELVSKTQPTVAETIKLNYDYVYDYIIDGMIDASHNMPIQYSLSNLGFDVAIKTGTPQTTSEQDQNSFFIGFAPADDPQIAFAGVIEGGEYSKYMIRDIILAYADCYGLGDTKPTAKLPDEVRPKLDGIKQSEDEKKQDEKKNEEQVVPVDNQNVDQQDVHQDSPEQPGQDVQQVNNDQPQQPGELRNDEPQQQDPDSDQPRDIDSPGNDGGQQPELTPGDPPVPDGNNGNGQDSQKPPE